MVHSEKITLNVLIIAGEVSGDNLGVDLIQHLQGFEHYHFDFWGTGGDRMAATGMEILHPVSDLEAIGLEILRKLPFF